MIGLDGFLMFFLMLEFYGFMYILFFVYEVSLILSDKVNYYYGGVII